MQPHPELRITATIDGKERTGIFEFGPAEKGGVQVKDSVRTGYLLDSSFDQLAAIFAEALDIESPDRAGINVDLGGGQHTIQIEFDSPGETQKDDGSYYQWGTTADADTLNAHSATGADEITQQQVFMNFFRRGKFGSISEINSVIEFRFGQYCEEGVLDDYIPVVPESPEADIFNDQPGYLSGSITLVETRDLDEALDAVENDER